MLKMDAKTPIALFLCSINRYKEKLKSVKGNLSQLNNSSWSQEIHVL